MKSVRYYLSELAIVTTGVLLALALNNLKENYQDERLREAALEAIAKEVEENRKELEELSNRHKAMLDSIEARMEDPISLETLLVENGGFQVPSVNNHGLVFYSSIPIDKIEYRVLSQLLAVQSLSEILDKKMDKLLDFLYANWQLKSPQAKRDLYNHVWEVWESEYSLMELYDEFQDPREKAEE